MAAAAPPLVGLIGSWTWLHAVSLAAVIAQPTTPARFLGRYSLASAVVMLSLALTLPAVALSSRRLRSRLDDSRVPLTSGTRTVAITALALALFVLWAMDRGGVTLGYLVLRLYLTVVLVTVGLWVVTRPEPAGSTATLDRRRTGAMAVALASVAWLVSVSWLRPFPGLLWTDEGYNTSLALSFARTGVLEAPIFHLVPSMQGPNYSLVYMGLGAWYQLFGVELGAARLFTLLVGIAGVSLLYRTAEIAHSAAAAPAAALVTLHAFAPNNVLRADVAVMVCLGLAFYGFVRSRAGAPWGHAVAGLATGFALDGHPNAYRFALAFTVAYLLVYGRGLATRGGYRPLVLLGLGQAAGLALYVGLYGTIAPERFLARLGEAGVALDPGAVPRVVVEQVLSALRKAPLLLGLAALGVVAALRRRGGIERLLLTVVAAAPIALGLLYGYYRDYYLVHMLVPLGLLGGGAVQDVIARFAPSQQRVVAGTLTALVVVAAAGRLSREVRTSAAQDYQEALVAADRIRALVPPSAVFVGVDPFYLRMHDYPRFVEFNTGPVLAAREGSSEAAAWDRIRPDAVALVGGYPIAMPESLRAYVQDAGFTRVGCWTNPKLGVVELFMRVPGERPEGASCEPLPATPPSDHGG